MHVFDNHLLQPLNERPLLNVSEQQLWTSLYLLLCLFLLAIIRAGSYNRLLRIIQSTFSKQILQQLEREEQGNFKAYSLALNLLFLANLSFLLYKLNSLHPVVLQNKSEFSQFLFFFSLSLAFLVLRYFSDQLLALFTDERKLFTEYRSSVSLVNQAFGIFLFPWMVLAEFTKFSNMLFLWVGVTVILVSIFLKWYRGMVMGLLEYRIGLLQIFSYFCGLEILPLLVAVKFLIETF